MIPSTHHYLPKYHAVNSSFRNVWHRRPDVWSDRCSGEIRTNESPPKTYSCIHGWPVMKTMISWNHQVINVFLIWISTMCRSFKHFFRFLRFPPPHLHFYYHCCCFVSYFPTFFYFYYFFLFSFLHSSITSLSFVIIVQNFSVFFLSWSFLSSLI